MLAVLVTLPGWTQTTKSKFSIAAGLLARTSHTAVAAPPATGNCRTGTPSRVVDAERGLNFAASPEVSLATVPVFAAEGLPPAKTVLRRLTHTLAPAGMLLKTVFNRVP